MKRISFLLLLALATTLNVFVSAQQPTKTISGGVVNGKAVNLPTPAYPAAAKAVGAQGSVNVQVLIDESGSVVSANAVSGHPLLRSATEKAAIQATFRPTLLSGKPVKVSGVISYNFVLPKTDSAGSEPGSGQRTVDSTPPQETGENMSVVDVIGISASLQMLHSIAMDDRMEAVSNLMYRNLVYELGNEELPGEFALLNEIETATKERRLEFIRLLIAKLKADVPNENASEIALGEQLGDLLGESLKRTSLGNIDNSRTKIGIMKLKDLVILVQREIPLNLKRELNKLVDFSEKSDIDLPENLRQLDETLDRIGDIVFEDTED